MQNASAKGEGPSTHAKHFWQLQKVRMRMHPDPFVRRTSFSKKDLVFHSPCSRRRPCTVRRLY